MMSAIAGRVKDLSLDVKNRSARYLLDSEGRQQRHTVPVGGDGAIHSQVGAGLMQELAASEMNGAPNACWPSSGCALLFAGRDFEGQDPSCSARRSPGWRSQALTGRPVTPDSSRGTVCSRTGPGRTGRRLRRGNGRTGKRTRVDSTVVPFVGSEITPGAVGHRA